MNKIVRASIVLKCALALSSISQAAVLVDDTFGDGSLATNPDPAGTGFSVINLNTGSASESGGSAVLASGGTQFSNVGIYSNDAVDFAAYTSVTATWVVSGVTGAPGANGMFFGFNENNTVQYRTDTSTPHHNFGFILDNDHAFPLGIGITANDWGPDAPVGNRNGQIQLDIGDFTLGQLQDGFTLSFTAYSNDTFDWSVTGLGAADGSGTGVTMSGGITYATQFDSDDRVFAHIQRGNNASGAVVMDVNSINVTAAIPEPSTYALLAGALGLVSVMVRRRRA